MTTYEGMGEVEMEEVEDTQINGDIQQLLQEQMENIDANTLEVNDNTFEQAEDELNNIHTERNMGTQANFPKLEESPIAPVE